MTVTRNVYGKTTAESLRLFLEFWPDFSDEFVDAWHEISKEKEHIFGENHSNFSWYQFYELPIKEHAALQIEDFSQDEQLSKIFQNLRSSKDQIAAIPATCGQVDSYFEEIEPPTKDEAVALMPLVAVNFGISISKYHAVRCVLYHGCFLNELIDRVREGDDKALFDAIRIDPTAVGCKSITLRISKAAFLQDTKFFTKLKASISGKFGRREQDNFQKMRLIFEVLYEVGATRLTDKQLYQLFVEELELYDWNAEDGGKEKALRKFADTYMKQNATT
ncbi:hypothetical protein GALL_226690 [mine drainage metagenome]|uniref:Uncharacterized protein n=1 Tax=mine drainage metagenome TaxID=410659 RepID=A0A1J5RGQ0_9ZZZZ